jgi:hypothetical protein
MWWYIGIKTKTMPTKINVDSKHKLSWNTKSFNGLNTQWFFAEHLQVNDITPQRHPQWLEVLYCKYDN